MNKEEFNKQLEINKETCCESLSWSGLCDMPCCMFSDSSYSGHCIPSQVMKKKECMSFKGKHPCKHHTARKEKGK